MEDTLKKLTDRIYEEGIEKANSEADAIITEAKVKAENIIGEAKKQSNEIIAKAEQDSDEIKKKINSELEMTAKQSISAIKQSIADIMLSESLDAPLNKAFKDDEFIKEMIATMLKNWDIKSENSNFELLYPATANLESFLKEKFSELTEKNISFTPSKDVTDGFVIKSKADGYKISFSEESFNEFIKNYIRPRTFELLFK
ncbi:V-type ATP synthase subunit E [Bacteroidales bacterium OttesenSCG-928-K03]|nr:V-type ATP synthase subunit E [Bacteroidales bacterium OttesenSCG-928-K22]MDL2242276.1 V-type ATP synthase subunit E [Bacteroidales bacterium OttesenSCG-928-K03]